MFRAWRQDSAEQRDAGRRVSNFSGQSWGSVACAIGPLAGPGDVGLAWRMKVGAGLVPEPVLAGASRITVWNRAWTSEKHTGFCTDHGGMFVLA